MVTHSRMKSARDRDVDFQSFKLSACIGIAHGGGAHVYAAQEVQTVDGPGSSSVSDRFIAVRVCTMENSTFRFGQLQNELKNLRELRHPNILPLFKCFTEQTCLFLTFPLMDYGSITDVIHARFIFGIPEVVIAYVLHAVLKALQYLHTKSFIHRAVRGSHILIASDGRTCLTGFRYGTSLIVEGRKLNHFHGLPETAKPNLLWLAPEILQQNLLGYSTKSDIYSVGISACEMANGFPPFSDMEHMQMLLEKLRGTQPRLLDSSTMPVVEENNEQGKRTFSKHFHAFTELCLRANPAFRPSASELVCHPFFKQLKKSKHNFRDLLYPLQPLTLTKKGRVTNSEGSKYAGHMDDLPQVEWNF